MTEQSALTEQQARRIIDRLQAEGFQSGFDCAAYCMDGHFGQRSKRWGEPKSGRFEVGISRRSVRRPVVRPVVPPAVRRPRRTLMTTELGTVDAWLLTLDRLAYAIMDIIRPGGERPR